MRMRLKLPVGIESFSEFVSEGFYYVDKTGLIVDLLHNWGKVNLFTRPRRFGKSLNMNMLKSFFEIGCDKTLFNGLKIAQEKELCDKYMGQFPVISVSLKDVDGLTFEAACGAMRAIIGMEAMRFSFLENSDKLSKQEKVLYRQLIQAGVQTGGMFEMAQDVMVTSLRTLSFLLSKHYGCKVILLIDEYDVPLDKAFQAGYYNEMVSLVRSLFSSALKSNENLFFAVLTGCLRVSKESIFTGLNNLKVMSAADVRFDEYFGFTDDEVRQMLAYYELSDRFDVVKEWYDGYRFGNVSVYCPWDVINYCDEACADRTLMPKSYWLNTSSNSIVRRFIDKATRKTQDEIEELIAGEAVWKEIHPELTYSELDKTIDNLWSVLFTTGYLTQRGKGDGNKYLLAIPNMEVRQIFVSQINEWFKDITQKDTPRLNAFCAAFQDADAKAIEEAFTGYLKKTISIRDTSVRKTKKENFYHGILLGLLSHMEDWSISSNAESGDGYSDILIEIAEQGIGIVIEVKYGENGMLDAACEEALEQIENNHYEQLLHEHDMNTIIKYGIACFQKRCKVVIG